MSDHAHVCPRCGGRWHCGLDGCQAPALEACPGCFCAELERVAGVELARLALRPDAWSWVLAGLAAGLMFVAATWRLF